MSAFDKGAKYPTEPLSIKKNKTENMTAKDHAAQFREFLKHYKRPLIESATTERVLS